MRNTRVCDISNLALYKTSFVQHTNNDPVKTEICEDIQEECSKYGEVMDMKIPRPSGGSRQSAGIGKVCSVFMCFDYFGV